MPNENNGRFKRFSVEHPFIFAAMITFILLLLYILAAIAGQIFDSSTAGSNLIEALGRLVGSLLFVAIILRFGWQEQTGLTRLSGPIVWLLALAILAYEVVTYVYPYLGSVDLSNANAVDTTAVALNALMTGPLEEFPFRGLILFAFVLFFRSSRAGVWKAVLLSAFFFGASHLVHILFGRPVPQAILIAVIAGMGGITYAAILLRWRTIWPAVALHSGLNSLASIVAFNTPDYSESVENLLLTVFSQIPLVILGCTIISRTATKTTATRPA